MTESSESLLFGELRSLVHGARSREAFERVLGLVERAEAERPGAAERWSEWLVSGLSSWSASHCSVVCRPWSPIDVLASKPWSALVRGVEVDGFDFANPEHVSWLGDELLEALPGIEHLGLVRPNVKKAAVEAARASGVLERVRSMGVRGAGMRAASFGAWMGALERSEVLDELVFEDCGMGRAHVERLFSSPALGRLRVLGMPSHASFTGAQAEFIAQHVGACARLEVLDLDGCRVGARGARALASATWPASFRRLRIARARVGADGVGALLESGLFAKTLEDPSRLDLRAQSIGVEGLAALVRHGALESVRELLLDECNLMHLDALGAAPEEQLSSLEVASILETSMGPEAIDGYIGFLERAPALHTLDAEGSRMGEAFGVRVLELERSTPWRVLSLSVGLGSSERVVGAALDWYERGGGERLDMVAYVDLDGEVAARCRGSEWVEVVERVATRRSVLVRFGRHRSDREEVSA